MEPDAQSGETSPVETLLDVYRDGYNDYDAEAVLACFAFPVTVWQFGKGYVFDHPDDLLENIERLLEAYEAAGVVETEYDLTDWIEGDGAASALVEWAQGDAEGDTVHAFTCHTLFTADADGALKIAAIINL